MSKIMEERKCVFLKSEGSARRSPEASPDLRNSCTALSVCEE